ncbi:hypothetical protein M1M07_02645 [Rhodococcus sp. HM1]|uniref:hypothetical protein n=1 Tax=Rhodococcus sp. HM1 TaxID=2937759 RepID=UPI00200B5526|nr:hypothetical protein [Rhodococcus sp. HM1]MCK8670016.1 hypothetical protein [Rhodococcus sp. HM1]
MGVTQRVDPEPLVAELLARGRAAVAFDHDERVDALPARVVSEGEKLRAGLHPESLPADAAFDRVTLILDDGSFWFELRAVNLRGRMVRAADVTTDGLAWFDLEQRRATGWDYAKLHEEPS